MKFDGVKCNDKLDQYTMIEILTSQGLKENLADHVTPGLLYK